MKKKILIALGSLALFIVFSLWLYLLLFGTPAEVRNTFTNLGLGGHEATPIDSSNLAAQNDRQINVTSGTLSQLTAKPVAGFALFSDLSSSTAALYAERGTGHVYQINLTGGTENRLLQKTLVGVSDAFFSPDGSAVVLIVTDDRGQLAYLEELSPNKPPHQFPETASNIQFSGARDLRYTITDEGGTTGYSYNLDTAVTNQLFNTYLTDVVAIWRGEETFLYSRPTPNLRGTLYSISGNILTSLGDMGISFSALINPIFLNNHIETYLDTESGELTSHTNRADIPDATLDITALSDKCVFDQEDSQRLWCGAPVERLGRQDQANWYKGLVSFSDLLWEVNLREGGAVVKEDFIKTTGQPIDVIDPTIDPGSSYLLFKNKTDDTLWLKRLVP